MAYLNGLLGVIKEPTGVWETIIKAFEGSLGNYVLAVILLTVVLRLVWSVVETIQKWSQQKQAKMQEKIQPELDALAKKYEKQPQVLKQKQNEVQQKHMGKTMTGSCIIMIVIMALNMLIFFSLFSSLNGMASYKAAVNYETNKYTYVNCIDVVDEYLTNGGSEEIFKDYDKITFNIVEDKDLVDAEGNPGQDGVNEKYAVMYVDGQEKSRTLYKTDYSYQKEVEVVPEGGVETQSEETPTTETVTVTSNEAIIELLNKYFPKDEDGNIDESADPIIDDSNPEDILYRSEAIQNAIMEKVYQTYEENKDDFLWINNVWVADTTFKKAIPSYSTLVSQIGAKNVEKNEKVIYDAFMTDLKAEKQESNGYFILPLLCVLVAVATTELTNFYNRRKNKKKGLPPPKQGGIMSKILMPSLLGVFALFYNSVFAIYMLIGQIMSMILSIPQQMVVDVIIEKNEKKKEKEEKSVVDYTRKF